MSTMSILFSGSRFVNHFLYILEIYLHRHNNCINQPLFGNKSFQMRKLRTFRERKPLTGDNLLGAFYVLGIGSIFSSLAFIGELMWNKIFIPNLWTTLIAE